MLRGRRAVRTLWRVNHPAIVLALTLALGCHAAPQPSNAEVYALVLERAREELALGDQLAIHPRLAMWGEEAPLYAPLTDFNAYDTTAVPQLLEREPAYRLCTPTAAGACQDEPGVAAVILSDLRELGPRTVGVRLIVSSAERGRFQRHYFARVAAGLGGWSVVEFREVPSAPQ